MFKMNRWIALAIILVLVATLGMGCAKKPAEEPADTGDQAAPAPPPPPQIVRYNLGTEPETYDSAKATGQPEFTCINAVFEGLVRLDANYMPQPAMAESWDVSADQLEWTFHLRDGVVWNDGTPVTADDFKYAWLRVLNPETAADYAYQLYYIKNGMAYNDGAVGPEEVGIEAVDDQTLKVTLESAAPYFLSLMAFPTYFPVPQHVVEQNETWAAEADTIVSNGPFDLVKWEHKNVLEMVPNDKYWDRDAIKLEKLLFYMVEESSTELTMYETDEIEIGDNPPLTELDQLVEEGIVTIGPDLATYYYIFNVEKEPFDDPLVRKAFTLAINREQLVTYVTKGGQKPALAFVPFGITNPVTGKDYREEGGDYYEDNAVEEAQNLLADAGYPNGEGLPPIEILYNTSEGHKAIAETIQEMWKQNLGVQNITLTNQEWKVYLATRDEGNFQVARAGWGADYLDPMTFLDMWTKDNGNNNSNWWSEEYDALIAKIRGTGDQSVRYPALHEAEDILMDEMPILPLYFYTDPYMMKDWVKGVVKYTFGPSLDFKDAWVEAH